MPQPMALVPTRRALFLGLHQIHPPKFTHIAETQLLAVVQRECGMHMFVRRLAGIHNGQMSRHLQVNDERITTAQTEDKVFGAAVDGLYTLIPYLPMERIYIVGG